MKRNQGGALCALVLALSAIVTAGCAGEPVRNCWDWRFTELVPAPPLTEELLFACKANPVGVAIRRDGAVFLLRDPRAPWALGENPGKPVFTVDRRELEEAATDVNNLPPIAWWPTKSVEDDLECFGRPRDEAYTVKPLVAGARKPTPEVERLARWVRKQEARAKALAPKR